MAATPSTPRGTAAAAAGASSSPPAAAEPVDLLDFMSMEAPAAASDDVLLGGVGEPSTTATAATVATRVRLASASSASMSSSPNQPGLDLLGVGGGESPPSSQAFAANGSSSAGAAQTLGDLLGGGTGDIAVGSNGAGGGTQSAINNGGGSGSVGVGTAAMGNGEQAWPGAGGQRTSAAGSPLSRSAAVALGHSASAELDLSGLFLGDAGSPSASSPSGLRGSAGSGGIGGGFTLGGRSVRPLSIATGEFGKRWMACTGERKAAGLRLSPGLGSPAAVAQRLAARLGVHTVEVIPQTAEGICAGQLDGGGVCLVHCKVGCLSQENV